MGSIQRLTVKGVDPALKLAKEGKFRWETMEDVWCGLVVKAVCDHLQLVVNTVCLEERKRKCD